MIPRLDAARTVWTGVSRVANTLVTELDIVASNENVVPAVVTYRRLMWVSNAD